MLLASGHSNVKVWGINKQLRKFIKQACVCFDAFNLKYLLLLEATSIQGPSKFYEKQLKFVSNKI